MSDSQTNDSYIFRTISKISKSRPLAMCIYKFHVITKVSYGIPEISPKFQNQVFSLIWQCIYTN